MSGDSHPARKVDKDELKEKLKNLNQGVPALTVRTIALEFPEVEPQTIGNNLDDLADEGEINRFNDGNSKMFWYPRPGEEAGTISYRELVDDSIDWDEVEVHEVPKKFSDKILEERYQTHREQTFWGSAIHASQLGLMVAFGLVILGIGAVVGGSFGIGQENGALIFRTGLYLSLFVMVGYVLAIVLDNLAAEGYVAKDPRTYLNNSD